MTIIAVPLTTYKIGRIMKRGSWSTFLPGIFRVTRGERADYLALERFHYRRGRPATWAGVWVVRYGDGSAIDRVVAVGVLSFPCVNCDARDRALGLARMPVKKRLRYVNEHVRVISRVVVHPQFRAMGLASRLVSHICEESNVRWIEAMAAMGRVHPLFERGGMKCLGEGREGVRYYLWEREEVNREDMKHEEGMCNRRGPSCLSSISTKIDQGVITSMGVGMKDVKISNRGRGPHGGNGEDPAKQAARRKKWYEKKKAEKARLSAGEEVKLMKTGCIEVKGGGASEPGDESVDLQGSDRELGSERADLQGGPQQRVSSRPRRQHFDRDPLSHWHVAHHRHRRWRGI